MSMICICDGSKMFPRCDRNGDNKCSRLEPTGYGYDELKDFDMGYKDRPKSRITPFMGTSR